MGTDLVWALQCCCAVALHVMRMMIAGYERGEPTASYRTGLSLRNNRLQFKTS